MRRHGAYWYRYITAWTGLVLMIIGKTSWLSVAVTATAVADRRAAQQEDDSGADTIHSRNSSSVHRHQSIRGSSNNATVSIQATATNANTNVTAVTGTATAAGTTFKIIGGVAATLGEYPSFAFPDNGYCGATLIWDDVILTAAHCLAGFDGTLNNENRNTLKKVTVHIGGTRLTGDWNDGGEDATTSNAPESLVVDWALPYPIYNRCDRKLRGDIMLVFLKSLISKKSKIAPWNANDDIPINNQVLTAIGHGVTSDSNGDVSVQLQKATRLTVIDSSTCAAAFAQNALLLTLDHVCTTASPQSACFGDSGGPLYTKAGVVVGVTSGGDDDCLDANRPNRYTRVSSYADWIQRNICHYSNKPPTTKGLCAKYPSPCGGVVGLPETPCTFFGVVPGTLVHKINRATGTCTEQCYALSKQTTTTTRAVKPRRGSHCGPCPKKGAAATDSCQENNDDN